MATKYHTVIIGGGLLGVATAISLQRRLEFPRDRVLLIERRTLAAGLSAHHSGIVRAAHRSPTVATLARHTTSLWKNLDQVWGVHVNTQETDALWITPDEQHDQWKAVAASLNASDVSFEPISQRTASEMTHGLVAFDTNERVFRERGPLLIDPAELSECLAAAVNRSNVEYMSDTAVIDFDMRKDGRIGAVHTMNGPFECDNVVNAAGAWSPQIFDTLGVQIPIGLERVFTADFAVDADLASKRFPLIADYGHRTYLRPWAPNRIHMHTPRSRDPETVVRHFQAVARGEVQVDAIYDVGSHERRRVNEAKAELAEYAQKLHSRIPDAGATALTKGGFAFFDITPDLRFIIGPDNLVPNLFHNLGAGEAMKFAPVLGEIVADSVVSGQCRFFDRPLNEFSISRFRNAAARRDNLPKGVSF